MATMLGMSGSDSFQASTQGLSAGKHTFFALLVDDQHAPLNPPIAAQVELMVQWLTPTWRLSGLEPEAGSGSGWRSLGWP